MFISDLVKAKVCFVAKGFVIEALSELNYEVLNKADTDKA